MQKCKCDHDKLTIKFDPAKARELALAWERGTPITINLRDCTKDELAHVAACCLTALGEWNDNGQRTHCWRLYHAGVDLVRKLATIFVSAFDEGEQFRHEAVAVTGIAAQGAE